LLRAELRQAFFASLLFAVPVFLIAKAPMVSAAAAAFLRRHFFFGFPLDEALKWTLTTPVQFVIGWRFHKGAYAAVRRGGANMDVLVSLGTSASYGYSVLSILHHHFTAHHATGARHCLSAALFLASLQARKHALL
jgi:P-type Cu+ transporter